MYYPLSGGMVHTEDVYKWPKLRYLAGDAKLRTGDPLRNSPLCIPHCTRFLSTTTDSTLHLNCRHLSPFVGPTRSVTPAVGPSHTTKQLRRSPNFISAFPPQPPSIPTQWPKQHFTTLLSSSTMAAAPSALALRAKKSPPVTSRPSSVAQNTPGSWLAVWKATCLSETARKNCAAC